MKRILHAAALLGLMALSAVAQSWDFTGNDKLNGSYFFREVVYFPDSAGQITGGAAAAYGTIAFDGRGSYTINGTAYDSAGRAGALTNLRGTYSISASGYGFFDHPLTTGGRLHGFVAPNGTLIGSGTEALVNDIFIAVPVSTPSNASFSGSYTLDYLAVGNTQPRSYGTTAVLTPNGGGTIGTINAKSYLGGTGTTPVSTTQSNAVYSFLNGAGTLRFQTPSNSTLPLQGNKLFYLSPDGRFFFGGSSTGFDLFVGVKRGAAPRLDGLYYSVGLNFILDQSVASLDTFHGAFTGNGSTLLEHQRFLSTLNGGPLNYTSSGALPTAAVTDYTDAASAVEYTVSEDGGLRIGLGQAPYLGLRIAVRGPKYTEAPGAEPYIFPTGVVNAASFAPFTKGVSPGELISIYGANLATSTVVTQGGVPFPTIAGGVRVLINNRAAPIYFVSPSQIAAIVPYATTEPIVQVQVERGGVLSNAVTAFRFITGPGIFSQGQSGEGFGAILHSDYSLVTDANPAKRGETVQVFLTGLGNVFPSIAEGGLGGNTQASLNNTLPNTVAARVDNVAAEVAFSGLAPGLAGLYQVNLKIPASASLGWDFVDIATPDMITSQVVIPVAALASDLVRSAEVKPFVRRR